MNNKKVIIGIVIILVVVILVVIGIFVFRPDKSGSNQKNNQQPAGEELPAPEFLTDQEKNAFGLSDDVKAQVLSRDELGEVTVYKIINRDQDIIPDPSEIPSISPRR